MNRADQRLVAAMRRLFKSGAVKPRAGELPEQFHDRLRESVERVEREARRRKRRAVKQARKDNRRG